MSNLHWPKRSHFRSDRAKTRRFLARLVQAERDAKDALVVSHAHCLDGVGAVIMTLRALGHDQVGVVYAQPGDMPRVLGRLGQYDGKGRTLFIADLSVNGRDFDAIVGQCARLVARDWRIEWRDHHHKQWEGIELDRLKEHLEVLEVDTKAQESGASLQQQALAKKDAFAKRLAQTIRDRDLWWNETEDSETLEFAINWMGEEAFTQHYLAKSGNDPVVDHVIAEAAGKERARIEHDTQRLLKEARFFGQEDQRVAVVYGWLPKNVGLHRVLQEDGVQVAINVRPNGFVSLRSRKEADVCQIVASQFDGGGHPNASGAALGLDGAGFWWYVLRRGRVPRVDEMVDAATKALKEAA